MELSNEHKRELDAALRDAFRSYATLRRMVQLGAGRGLDDYVAPGGLRVVVPDLIEAAEAEGWLDSLVTGAILENPGNPRLRSLVSSGAFAQAVAIHLGAGARELAAASTVPGYAVDELGEAQLQGVVSRAVGFQDPAPWAARLVEHAARVCRIEVIGSGEVVFGTGVLVGPDLVLTNHHVMQPLLIDRRGGGGGTALFRFDHRVDAAGRVHRGPELALTAGDRRAWLVAASPPSPADIRRMPISDASVDELDFALVRLAGRPGDEMLGSDSSRGWLDLTAKPPPLATGVPLLILQHPERHPVKMALDTSGVIAVNANRSRVTYHTNTLDGSSGSPCFTLGLEPVALHHAGEPRFGMGRNQGIPLATIAEALAVGGVLP